MKTERFYSLDFMKCLAAIFITNSHFIPLYKDVSVSLATFGVHGNALFFFVSGFLLMKGFERKESFANWYKKRLYRLFPAVFIWVILWSVILEENILWQQLIAFKGYWFLQCIAVYYVLFYIVNATIGGG